ncbi:hypothetical protein [Streptomyces sp. NBC_01497]|uniref:hypothetical protein n=1 Tax=Streptomyces sp. NBC_01497 TaxID=2903885 RepID=UPI002E37A593|nr:hypothetical protein [Streptomyces sp. NBC_01497]
MAVRAWEPRVRTEWGAEFRARTEASRRDPASPAPDAPPASDACSASPADSGPRDTGQREPRTAGAVALGEAERWSKAADDSARTPASTRPRRRGRDLGVSGPEPALALIVTASLTSTTCTTSGGSGSSGGGSSDSGGGVGGEGGGSW